MQLRPAQLFRQQFERFGHECQSCTVGFN